MASTSVVLPWSTWAMMAILRMLELKKDPSRNAGWYYFTMRGGKSPRKTRLLKDLSSSHVILRTAFSRAEGSVDSSIVSVLVESAQVLRAAKNAALRMTTYRERSFRPVR